MKTLVVGMGEVGAAIHKLLGGDAYDISQGGEPEGSYDVLHICYPDAGGGAFIHATHDYMQRHDPSLVIIHSTVQVGTTRKLGPRCVHSPVSGLHSIGLARSMPEFIKPVGGIDPVMRQLAESILQGDIGCQVFRTVDCGEPETTELMKLMDTAYFGWNIIFEKEMHDLCQQNGANFEMAYQMWNESYNEGYRALNRHNFQRPVLEHSPGKTGGHCVLNNARLIDSWLTNTLIERNETY